MHEYDFIHHGLNESRSSRGERGVAIILLPTAVKACNAAGNHPPSISSSNHNIVTSGRAIAITLNFKGALINTKRALRKNKTKHINTKAIVSSLYYPYKQNEHDEFIEFAQDFVSSFDRRHINIVG